jgi:chromosome partitioning protein
MLLHGLSEDGVRQLTRLIWRAVTTVNPKLTRFAVLPVMINTRVNLQKKVLAQMITHYGPEKILKGIRPDIALAEAFADHLPVRAFAPRSRGALDYHLMANELSVLWRWDHTAPAGIDRSITTVPTPLRTRVLEARSQ